MRRPKRMFVAAAAVAFVFTAGGAVEAGSASAASAAGNASAASSPHKARSSPSHSGREHLVPGSDWTIEIDHARADACEIETIGAGHDFTTDRFGDSGTYKGGRLTVTEKWTAGASKGLVFKGTWSRPAKRFRGPFSGYLTGYTGQLVEGAVQSFHGSTC